jgi:glucose/arabinose dehydrogenase
MGTMRRSWIVITLFAAACGSSKPPAPSTGTGSGTVQTITGRERVGWDQPAGDAAELATFRYVIYVDNTRNDLGDVSCAATAGAGGFACSGKLPAMSSGAHSLEIAAVNPPPDSGESSRSTALQVIVSAALTAESALAAEWQGGEIAPTHDGIRLRFDKLSEGLDRPTDASFAPDGRLFVTERSGRVRVVANGQLQAQNALSLPPDATTGAPQAILSIAFDPDFSRTGFVFLLQTADSTNGTAVYLARYRELRGLLGQRAVLFQSTLDGQANASALMRFGPDGKLYVVSGADDANGRLFRLNADGTMPRDQAGTAPAVAGGVAQVGGLAWRSPAPVLWIVDNMSGTTHVSGVSMSAPPVRAVVRERVDLPPGPGSLVFYTGDAIPQLRNDGLLASADGSLLRLHFDESDGTRIAASEALAMNEVGPIRVVAVGPDGAIYFSTDTALGKLSAVR